MALPLDNPVTEDQVAETTTKDVSTPTEDYVFSDDLSIETRALARSLGVENISELEHYKHRLESIVKWAVKDGAKDADDVAWKARQMAKKLGGPNINQSVIEQLAVYAKLNMDKAEIERKLARYERE